MTDTTSTPTPEPSEHTAVEQCVQCEQTDNHPKVHVLGRDAENELVLLVHHLDCLPHNHRRDLIGQAPHMADVFHAVLHEGKRGEELRQHIADVHAALDAQQGATSTSSTRSTAPTTEEA